MQSCLANGVVSVHPPLRQMAQQAARVVVQEPITGALAVTMQCGGSNYRVWNSRKRIAAPRCRARCEYLRDGKATSLRDRVSGSSSSRANSAIAPRTFLDSSWSEGRPSGLQEIEIARDVVHGGSPSNFPECTSPDENKAERLREKRGCAVEPAPRLRLRSG